MELDKLIKKIQENGTLLSKKVLKDACKFAKKCGSAELAYELACVVEGTARKEMEQVVLKAQQPKFCYLYARDIPGANVKAHQKVIIDKKDVEYAVEFASDIPSADIETLKDIVIEAKNPEYAYKFALEVDILQKIEKSLFNNAKVFKQISKKIDFDYRDSVKRADEAYKVEIHKLALDKTKKVINSLQQIVIDSRNGDYINLFKRDIDGADIKKLSLAQGRAIKACKRQKKDFENFTK